MTGLDDCMCAGRLGQRQYLGNLYVQFFVRYQLAAVIENLALVPACLGEILQHGGQHQGEVDAKVFIAGSTPADIVTRIQQGYHLAIDAGERQAVTKGAAANRVAVEACVEARNSGVEIEKEGKDILTNAAKSSPELKIAMETWKEIKFEFDTVDKLDVKHK